MTATRHRWPSATDARTRRRPLWVHYPDDTELFALDDQFLLGSDLLGTARAPRASDSAFRLNTRVLSQARHRVRRDFHKGRTAWQRGTAALCTFRAHRRMQPWYDAEDFTAYDAPSTAVISTPLEKIAVLQRGGVGRCMDDAECSPRPWCSGSVVARKERARRSSALMVRDPYTLWVALDSKVRR
jgi:alpha 1,3-glucosidase